MQALQLPSNRKSNMGFQLPYLDLSSHVLCFIIEVENTIILLLQGRERGYFIDLFHFFIDVLPA